MCAHVQERGRAPPRGLHAAAVRRVGRHGAAPGQCCGCAGVVGERGRAVTPQPENLVGQRPVWFDAGECRAVPDLGDAGELRAVTGRMVIFVGW